MQQFWRSSADKTVSLVSSTAAKAAALQLRHVSRALELWYAVRHFTHQNRDLDMRECIFYLVIYMENVFLMRLIM